MQCARSAHISPHRPPLNAGADGLPQVRASATARRQRLPKEFRRATRPSRLVTITSLGPVPKRWTCALISFSTHSSAGIVRVDALVLRSAAGWPRCAYDGTWILRRRKSTRGTVRPNASPSRKPKPTPRATATLSRQSTTASVSSAHRVSRSRRCSWSAAISPRS
jgi:hypothetical protein